MKKIFVSSPMFAKADPSLWDLLAQQKNISITHNPYDRVLTSDEVLQLAQGANILLASTENLNPLIEHTQSLEFISKIGVGLDNLDLPLAFSKKIRIHNTPNAATNAVAELTIGCIISLLRGVNENDSLVKKGQWKRFIGKEIAESTIGIIGWGRIGKRLTQLLQAFFAPQILIYDIQNMQASLANFEQTKNTQIHLVSLQDLLANSDVVSLHPDLNPTSRHLINEQSLSWVKPGAIILNFARGAIIDEPALINALHAKKLQAVGLDVFENEPYNGPLNQPQNHSFSILTSHLGACTIKARKQMDQDALQAVLLYLQNKPLLYEVTKANNTASN